MNTMKPNIMEEGFCNLGKVVEGEFIENVY